jgi:hypothetical protein
MLTRLLIALFVCMFSLIPCTFAREYRIETIMGSWLDVPVEALIGQLGIPDKKETIYGMDVLRYGEIKAGWDCLRTFTIKDNKVFRADSYGNNCPFGAVGPYKHWAYEPNYKQEHDESRVNHRSTGMF